MNRVRKYRLPRLLMPSNFCLPPVEYSPERVHGHLRSKRRIRRSLHSRVDGQSRGQIVDAISIRGPAEIEDRAIPGHWEGDCLAAPGTVTSQRWWNVIRVLPPSSKVPSKDTAAVVAALSRQVRKLPASL